MNLVNDLPCFEKKENFSVIFRRTPHIKDNDVTLTNRKRINDEKDEKIATKRQKFEDVSAKTTKKELLETSAACKCPPGKTFDQEKSSKLLKG